MSSWETGNGNRFRHHHRLDPKSLEEQGLLDVAPDTPDLRSLILARLYRMDELKRSILVPAE